MSSTTEFDYSSPAEVYTFNKRRGHGPSMTFRRFDTAATAIRYSIEELSGTSLPGAILEVNEVRYREKQIRKLYDSDAYPLTRQE